MSDGGVICSHSDLLAPTLPPPFSDELQSENGGGVRKDGGGLKQNLAQTRGENLIHAVPPELPAG